MLYDFIIFVCLIIVTINVILNLRNLKVPSNESAVPVPTPRVSILIPARNEEANIYKCVESLQKQDYPDYEIIILDDNSTDNTLNIINEIASKDNRVKIIKGEPLPEGWAGKAHACFQLAKTATGSWILFTDADTFHQPHMIRSVLAIAIENKLSLLSGFPKQIADTMIQKIAVPVFYFIIISLFPMWWLQNSKKPKPSFANGQFLLFPKDEYWRIGGHKAVKSRILEDVLLGAMVYKKGGKIMAIDLSPVVSCHMYHNIRAMWHGFAKSIYAFTSPLFTLPLLGIIGYILFLGPFYAVVRHFTSEIDFFLWRYIVLSQVIIIIFIRLLVNNHFKESIFSTIFHPFGLSFFFLNAVYVLGRRITGVGISWKQRIYKPETGVD